ncbi:hypothetical protein ACHIUS_09325 [Campylobacter coli]
MDIKIENATLKDREFIEKCFKLGLKEKDFYNTNFTDNLGIIKKTK